MKKGVLVAIVAVAVAAGVSFPRQAEAKKKSVIFYQSGEDLFPVGELPKPFDKETKLAGFKAGYKCDIFGIFWAYITIKNCEPVAVSGKRYFAHPALAKAISAKYKKSDMKIGFWKKHGKFILGLILIGGIGFFGFQYYQKTQKKKNKKNKDA